LGWDLGIFAFSFRNGIISASAKRIAAQYAPNRETEPAYKAPFRKRFYGVLRARRIKTAAGGLKRRDELSVKLDQKNSSVLH